MTRRKGPWRGSGWLTLAVRPAGDALGGICAGCRHRTHYATLCPAALVAPGPIMAGPMPLAIPCRCQLGPEFSLGAIP